MVGHQTRAPGVGWHKKRVPRGAFIQWAVIHGRLYTRDRLAAWGITNDKSGALFHGGMESHSHLFFECQFANQVWEEVRLKCGAGCQALNLVSEISWGIQNF